MTADDLLHQAVIALSSAKLLLDTGDSGDACNRAYYAMFDAARAALLASKLLRITKVNRSIRMARHKT